MDSDAIRSVCLAHRIIPIEGGDSHRYFIEQERDALEVAHEIYSLWNFSVQLIAVAREVFAQKWMQFSPPEEQKNPSQTVRQRANFYDSAITQLVDRLLFLAVRRGASDIHFESLRNGISVRLRQNGSLRSVAKLPRELKSPIFVRLKVLARLDIAEHFRPQDGRFQLSVGGESVDFRISSLPTKFGESIVLRILDRRKLFCNLQALSMPVAVAEAVRQSICAPSGLFLCVGPTGSGKTTTLYASLNELCQPEWKVLSVEDPVEYDLDGCLQVPVDLATGRTFALALRAFLRHDPDKIFVGEIRDEETAQVALRAALTGHLVLSTMHAATAREAMLRLGEMGVDANVLAMCLRGILNQRLLRLNCLHCNEVDHPSEQLPEILSALPENCFRRGKGCVFCEGTGCSGRRGIFEFFSPSALGRAANGPEISHTLAGSAAQMVGDGSLSVAEFLRQIPLECNCHSAVLSE
ncbi:MAG: GspE/PulE family protein [Puniceicoccales bacterium]|jgi:type IV pilus assembly protein PilB|nr:GspE/PulE family protein [Puniceicoccales bacterium]